MRFNLTNATSAATSSRVDREDSELGAPLLDEVRRDIDQSGLRRTRRPPPAHQEDRRRFDVPDRDVAEVRARMRPHDATPHVHHARHRSFLVVRGSVEVDLGASARRLVPGDSFVVPGGTVVGWRFLAHGTRLLTWASPGGALDLVQQVGTRVDVHTHRDRPSASPSPERYREVAEALGVSFPDLEPSRFPETWDAGLPGGEEAYFLRAGEGDRLKTPDALYTYLSRGRNTGRRNFAIHTIGAPGEYFGRHFHRQHTENFLCLAGRVLLWVNGTELLLTPGDFVHAPAGTIHTFAFDAHRTEMLGLLSPDVFEPFFEVLGSATEDHGYPEPDTSGGPSTDEETGPSQGDLVRLQDELDVVFVGPPPERRSGVVLRSR